MGSRAFIDNNFSKGKEFLEHFLDSPEFTLDTLRQIMPSGSSKKKKLDQEYLNKKSRYNRLIKAHCYFGLKPNSSTQDSLQHLKCDCGGSTGVLKFLLEELESY